MKHFHLFFIVFIAILLCTGCPSDPTPGPTTEPTPEPVPADGYTVSFIVFDKDTDIPLTDVDLTIIETGLNQTYASHSFNVILKTGVYNLILSKSNYKAKGYVLHISEDIIITVRLKIQENPVRDYENISGNLHNGPNPYTDDFTICASTLLESCVTEIYANAEGAFSAIQSICGNNTISGFTKTGDKVNTIAYQKDIGLEPGSPLSGLLLNLADATEDFSGTLPPDGDLRIRLNNSYLIALQDPVDAVYSFSTHLSEGDSLTLESLDNNGTSAYFTRENAGTSGGVNNLSYDIDIPAIDIDSSGDSYRISFDEVADASFYESFMLEINQGVLNEPYQGVNVTGGDIIIPKQLVNTEADQLIIFFRAVYLAGYNQSALLGNTLSFSNYCYGEINQTISSKRGYLFNYNNNYSMFYLRIEG